MEKNNTRAIVKLILGNRFFMNQATKVIRRNDRAGSLWSASDATKTIVGMRRMSTFQVMTKVFINEFVSETSTK